MKPYDFILIGGGIVGVSTALQLQQRLPDAKILLLEKENALARHQTGRNSGVIHAGVYYQPGSLKADFCKRGAAATKDFCKQHGLAWEQCGKLLVATNSLELDRMADLKGRCAENDIEVFELSKSELAEKEPNIKGLGALFVPATGITNYGDITLRIAELFEEKGGTIKKNALVTDINEKPGGVEVVTTNDRFEAAYVIVCGGLQADRLANMLNIDIDFQIIPFRGEYYQLPNSYQGLIKHLIYPIPDPELPFLGIHLTLMIDGTITIGPNAVLGFKREGYGRINIDLKDCLEMAFFPGFWKVIHANIQSGLGELKDSYFKPGYLRRVHKYCESISARDLLSYPTGIRAQAVMKDGSLVHDFLFAESERTIHVCNAPSPAATSAFPIGEYICEKAATKFNF